MDITVTGAGTAGVDGTYAPTTTDGLTNNFPRWTNGSFYLWYNYVGGQWEIADVADNAYPFIWYYKTDAFGDTPIGTWQVGASGSANAPAIAFAGTTAVGAVNGDGGTLQWTPSAGTAHYSLLNDLSDSTYISALMAYPKTDIFACDSAGVTGASAVTKITVKVRSSSQFSTSQLIGVQIYMGASWQTEVQVPIVDAYATYYIDFEGTWTQADLDALQISIIDEGVSADATNYVSEVSYIVTYTPGGGEVIGPFPTHFNT